MAAPGWVFSARRLKADTGWVPENTLRDGLAETCRWYVENGWLRP
jgi:dTDP-D-glucose 4,6-dehydratase